MTQKAMIDKIIKTIDNEAYLCILTYFGSYYIDKKENFYRIILGPHYQKEQKRKQVKKELGKLSYIELSGTIKHNRLNKGETNENSKN